MALVLADRVREGTNTAGTGTVTLTGAVAGFASFADQIGNGNTTYYTITDGTNWEVGVGTYNAGTLSRDTVIDSSTGSKINFAASFKDVFVTLPGSKAVSTDTLASPPAIGGTTPAAGTFTTLTATGQTSLGGAAGSEGLRVTPVASSTIYLQASGGVGGVTRTKFGQEGSGSSAGFDIYTRSGAAISFSTNGAATAEQFRVANTASAVNYVQVTGAATGGDPTISAQGSDADARLILKSKGSRGVRLVDSSNGIMFATGTVASSVNYLQTSPSATGQAPVTSVAGNDTNISQVFQSKGTGAIDLAAGSSGVNISNGGTVTAITLTNGGSNYTSFPSVALTAPTTAGGVQATASVARLFAIGPTVANGGTGYTVNDVVTLVGGTPLAAASTYRVTAVSGGVVIALDPINYAVYTALPTNPAATTGGTGTGLTLNAFWSVQTFTITNAGSGYVEQPTVTFSGGGGSGAAAYATVGSTSIVRSLGTNLDFYTPAGISGSPSFRVYDNGSSGNYLTTRASSGSVLLWAQTTSLTVSSGAGTAISFTTNSGSQEQFRVAHTASAVNYVQVTGAATGGNPSIQTAGSDANRGLSISSKGTSAVGIYSGAGTYLQFQVVGTNSAVNYLQAIGTTAGNSPSFAVAGSDTNIDLTLTPKGTGNVRFGTYTANMALVIQGYIEIKDSGGTVRKLAVIA